MIPNLNDEQARKSLTNSEMAKILSISGQSYARKKRLGRFSAAEAFKLCDFFDVKFEYLFESAE